MSIFNRKKDFKEIEPKKAFNVLKKDVNDFNYIFLDVRTPEEYEEGHIENALLLNIRSANFAGELENLDKNKTYYVYCRSGRRSAKAVQLMKKHGFNDLYNMIGGFKKWESEKLPIKK